jgi:hypothetical protein
VSVKSAFVGGSLFSHFAELLTEPFNPGVLAGYDIKGGVAMELRFAERARATRPALYSKRARLMRSGLRLSCLQSGPGVGESRDRTRLDILESRRN